jgi:hypothetical protein
MGYLNSSAGILPAVLVTLIAICLLFVVYCLLKNQWATSNKQEATDI